jgi:hypothetical protein
MDACCECSLDADTVIGMMSGRVVGVFDRANVEYMAYVDPNGSDTPFIVVNLAAFVLEDGVRAFLSMALAIAHEHAHLVCPRDEMHGEAFRTSWVAFANRLFRAWPGVAGWVRSNLCDKTDVPLTNEGRALVTATEGRAQTL